MNNYLKNKAFETYMLLIEGHDKSRIDERLKKYIYLYMKRDRLSFDKAIVKAILNMGKLTQCDPSWLVPASTRTTDGGKGSGNFGHKGRPGQVGGSAKSGGGSSELLKVSTEPTLADIDDGLAEAGIRKGDVVKVFGLRKDVLLSHLQNRLKAGKDWKGVLKPEQVAEARATRQALIDNGDTASKDFIKVDRSLARYDFINKLAEKLEGSSADEPVKAEEPKQVVEPKKEKRVKKEKLVEEPKATAKDLGTVSFTPNFKRGMPDVDIKNMYGKQLYDSESLAELIKKETGVAFNLKDDNTSRALIKASDVFMAEAGVLDWSDPTIKTLFNYETNIAKGDTINPMKLDSAVKKAISFMRSFVSENKEGDSAQYHDAINVALALNEIRKQQKEAGITQAVYDKMEKSNVIKSKLTDSNNFGKATADAYKEASENRYKKIKNIELSELGFVEPAWIDKLSAEFSGLNLSQYGFDLNDKNIQRNLFGGYQKISLETLKTIYTFELPSTLNYQDFVDNIKERADKFLDNFKNALTSNGGRGYITSTACDFISTAAFLQGLQDYKKLYGEPKYLDRHFKSHCLALGMMHVYATRKSINLDKYVKDDLADFLKTPNDSSVSNAFMEYIPKSIGTEEVTKRTKQTQMAEQLQKASTKPDIENDLMNTKISETKREGHNLKTLQNILKFMNKSAMEKYIKGGQRSAFGFTKDVSNFTHELMNGEYDLRKIDHNKKYNNKLLNSEEIGKILTAMTLAGDSYVPIKEPNKFGANCIINLMTACGDINDARHVKCIRYENMKDGYRNYNFKVGDSITFDGQHASCDEEFADHEGLKWFGDEAPCRFEVVGTYPRLDLEPFVWQNKVMRESEQLMAGFFKVKNIEDGANMKMKEGGHTFNVSVKKVQIEFDWDRLDEYLSLQARAFADYMGMYGDGKVKKNG